MCWLWNGFTIFGRRNFSPFIEMNGNELALTLVEGYNANRLYARGAK